MTTHRSTPIRRITHKRRRGGIRTWLMAFIRGTADEETAARGIAEADAKGRK
jgi:hypothetical protein